MKIIKKINSNFALAIDEAMNTFVVEGKGISFHDLPYEVENLKEVQRSFYNVDERIISSIPNISKESLYASEKIADYIEKKLETKLNPNFVFTFADHLDFTVKRIKQNLTLNYGITMEMEYNHPEEMDTARKIVKYLNKVFEIDFPNNEIAVIAMHIYEAENFKYDIDNSHFDENVINDVIKIIKQKFSITEDPKNFNYYRFATHVQYLLSRKYLDAEIKSNNKELFENVKNKYPDVYDCVKNINDYFKVKLKYRLGEEEQLYLMLHINRLISKEACNQ